MIWDVGHVLTTFICVMGVVACCSKESVAGQQEGGRQLAVGWGGMRIV